jgi:hypothetical protein
MKGSLLAIALMACAGKNTTDEPTDAEETGETGETAAELCGTAAHPLPENLTTLSWDNDSNENLDIFDFNWSFNGYNDTYETWKEVQHEAVRFDLEHPAKVHGFSVQWSNLSALQQDDLLSAGLYPDFGHNGFDFDAENPLWTGTRCASEVVEGEWVSFTFENPVYVAQPGLLYVAHKKTDETQPVWMLDSDTSAEGDCTDFDACHSAWNFPEIETNSHYNGWSFALPYDYRVRLHLEYTQSVEPSEKWFQGTGLMLSSRAAWGDFDNDGWDDILSPGPTLYRNLGDGSFENVSQSAGVTGISGSSGGVWGDYDNDGCLDFLSFAESSSATESLMHNNCDGTFSEVTESAGITDSQSYLSCTGQPEEPAPTAAAAWWDYNSDGNLDLYLSNFICWDSWKFYKDTVFRNNGDGSFSEVTGTQGFSSAKKSGRGATPADANGDGHTDILVNNYTLHSNLYFESDGSEWVDERAKEAGLEGHPDYNGTTRYYGHTIGAAWGDIDNDGDLDMVHANLAHPRFHHFSDKSQVLLNDGDGQFSDFSESAGLRYQETHSVPALADFDNDTVLDLVISAIYPGRPMDFYWGNGDGSFLLDVYMAGLTTENGWGVAVADYDHDGDPDLIANQLFQNARGQGEWVAIRAIGDVNSNRAAIGATVQIHVNGSTYTRHVQGGTGQGCQDSQTLHFGLGVSTQIDSIDVHFPGSESVHYEGPFDAGQKIWLYESGGHSYGWKETL